MVETGLVPLDRQLFLLCLPLLTYQIEDGHPGYISLPFPEIFRMETSCVRIRWMSVYQDIETLGLVSRLRIIGELPELIWLTSNDTGIYIDSARAIRIRLFPAKSS